MRILVTGAAGFIGSHLAERLVALGHEVRGIDCFTDYYSRALKALNAEALRRQGVDLMALDLAADDLAPAVEGAEFIVHLAAQPGISATTAFETYLRNNVQATHRLLLAAQQSPALRGFLNISTSSVYGADATGDESTEPRPTSYYGVTKLAAEQLVLALARDRGLPACSLRLFSVYGPRERPEKLYPRLIAAILDDKEFPLFAGSESHVRSFTYVDDVVDGLVAALDRFDACAGQILNIGSDRSITTAEGIRIVEDIIGAPARIVTRPRRPGDQLRTHANIDKARRLLGYEPATIPEVGLAREVSWYRDQIHGKVDLWEKP
ncbi:MAG: NAD-dependent epimerase/dehydratase family protein [Anaerolineae bacterium]|nr:NAD-dependent epimerase/dehydratase family protein [Anaerolineae bacterium]